MNAPDSNRITAVEARSIADGVVLNQIYDRIRQSANRGHHSLDQTLNDRQKQRLTNAGFEITTLRHNTAVRIEWK